MLVTFPRQVVPGYSALLVRVESISIWGRYHRGKPGEWHYGFFPGMGARTQRRMQRPDAYIFRLFGRQQRHAGEGRHSQRH